MRHLKWLILAALCIGLLYCGVAAADISGTCGDNLTWTLDGDGVLTISGSGDMEDYANWCDYCDSILTVVFDGNITSIGFDAFAYCDNLTSVTIPDSVTSIGRYAFDNCNSLTSITIPDSVTSIGDDVFRNCSSLISVTIPNSVTSIGNCAFFNCTSLTSVTIPDSVTSIAGSAFSGCTSLTSVTIPDSVTSIGVRAFNGCANLTDVYYTGSQESWESVSIGDGNDSLTAANITYNYDTVAIIASGTCGDNLTWTLDGDGVLTISGSGDMGDYDWGDAPWYSNCSSIQTVVFDGAITSIGGYAFCGRYSLTSVTIPDSVTSIGENAFYNCISLTSVTIPNSVTSIGDNAFNGCWSLTSITIPSSVTSIGYNAFVGCYELTSITVASSNPNYSSLNGVLFNKNQTQLIQYPAGKTDFSYAIPDSVTSIGDMAYWGCTSLTSVTIPNSVTSIGYNAFACCTSLTSVTIPDSVTSIGGDVFWNFTIFWSCTSLTSITVDSSNPNYSSLNGVLFNKNKTQLIQYPAGKTDSSYAIPNSVTRIGDSAFDYCTSLTSVTIPDSVTSIGHYAFRGCTSLTSVTIPDSVTSIGWYAFAYCDNLTSVTIFNPDTVIGDIYYGDGYIDVFDGCASTFVLHGWAGSTAETFAGNAGITFSPLTPDFILPASLTTIEADAFSGISAVVVQIPASVTAISGNPFAGSAVRYICGVSGSAAETFAAAYGYTFVPVTE